MTDKSIDNLVKALIHRFGMDDEEELSKSFVDGFNAGIRVSRRQDKKHAVQEGDDQNNDVS
ncbi:MAG: hypothetical protein QF449_14095 [Alphaproteobacteria bacterium]|jgi:hypothetical protein|nr:hypothetical protein [Alphaproteobacteria bacterium]MDP6590186.1 hypothetical protein [Alphaproteobacteria bacterium]MDP6819155.1 hypothetical protein [Alphaproteobacteria bacterium]|tara:strand:- start:3300 stop:3482 length:183 start_codon:yes stop_codon:yes gene_type:complete